MAKQYDEAFAFYEQLRHYYLDNKGRIRKNYKRITLKLLDYNDRSVNPDAFLRPPQFEAFEMYVGPDGFRAMLDGDTSGKIVFTR